MLIYRCGNTFWRRMFSLFVLYLCSWWRWHCCDVSAVYFKTPL